jgi:hypothetical protein
MQAVRDAVDVLFVIQSVIVQFLGVAFAAGLVLNLCGIGYSVTSTEGLVIKPLTEMRAENREKSFMRAAARSVHEPVTPSAEPLRLRGGARALSKRPSTTSHRTTPRERRAAASAWMRSHVEECLHLLLCAWATRGVWASVRADQWRAVRLAPEEVERSRDAILKKRRRAAQVGQLLGAGYTPRITFLAGMMLRSLQLSTRLRRVFDPSLGYAAGASLAAAFSQREWLPCILLGWGTGGVYWALFRVRPPGVAKGAWVDE